MKLGRAAEALPLLEELERVAREAGELEALKRFEPALAVVRAAVGTTSSPQVQ